MITVHWHLILYIITMILVLRKSFEETSGMDFTPILALLGAIIITAIYGGIFWW